MVSGPCQYNGDTMIDIHTGMNITERDFNRVVEMLIKAMEDEEISYQTQNKLLFKLAGLRDQVIKI
jgi:hemoglobin